MRGAVLRNTGDLELEVRDDLSTADVGPGEVRVGIEATGICHSDLHGMTGSLPQPCPAVLGHEGAGVILEVGAGVTNVAVGDHVIVAWTPPCGTCRFCVERNEPHLCLNVMFGAGAMPRFRLGDEIVHGFAGTGTFAEQTVLTSQGVVKIDPDVPLEIASLVGCGVSTGVGAAINTAKVTPGSTCVVFGCGGVGISAIQGARLAGAAQIVAVDMVDDKLETAKRFGATHGVKPDQLADLRGELTGGDGFDYGFEAIGLSATIRAAYDATRRGGTVCVIGAGRMDDMVSFSGFEMFFDGKTICQSYWGSTNVHRDFAKLINLWKSGRLDLEGMITGRLDLKDINDGIAAVRAGTAIRQVVSF